LTRALLFAGIAQDVSTRPYLIRAPTLSRREMDAPGDRPMVVSGSSAAAAIW
jgi:hypothetical protein